MTNPRNNYPKDHHYLPKCFLKAWTYDQNQTHLWVYRKEGNRVFGPSPKSTTSVCYKKHLYTRSECVEEKDKYKMETESFSNIDNEASNYLEYLTKQRGPINLSPKEKEPFSVFLNSLKARTPEIIEKYKLQAVPILQDNLKELLPYFKEKNPERYENFGLDTIVKFIRDKELINLISAMHWAIISIEDDYQNLLTSDRPLIRDGDIKQPMFGLVLAISPNKLFPVHPHKFPKSIDYFSFSN